MVKLKGELMIKSIFDGQQVKKEENLSSSSFIASSPHLTQLKMTPQSTADLQAVLSKINTFDFDVWDLVPLTCNQPLMATGLELFKKWEIDVSLEIKDELILKFFMGLEKG